MLSTGDDADDDNVIVIESVGVTGGDGRASSLGSVASRLSVEFRFNPGWRSETDTGQRNGGQAQRSVGDAPTLGAVSSRVVIR